MMKDTVKVCRRSDPPQLCLGYARQNVRRFHDQNLACVHCGAETVRGWCNNAIQRRLKGRYYSQQRF